MDRYKMDRNGECNQGHINKRSRQVGHALNNTASQFAAYSATVEAAGLPVAAAFGCMPGLLFGLRKG
jgi:hypothetical protein